MMQEAWKENHEWMEGLEEYAELYQQGFGEGFMAGLEYSYAMLLTETDKDMLVMKYKILEMLKEYI